MAAISKIGTVKLSISIAALSCPATATDIFSPALTSIRRRTLKNQPSSCTIQVVRTTSQSPCLSSIAAAYTTLRQLSQRPVACSVETSPSIRRSSRLGSTEATVAASDTRPGSFQAPSSSPCPSSNSSYLSNLMRRQQPQRRLSRTRPQAAATSS